MPIQRALLSVSDKSGIIDFARSLHEQGVELLSTGGTARAIREAGIPVIDICEFTGFPEMLDGRVKTLHPKVHAGLLYRRDDDGHKATMEEHSLQGIDLVCVNLYPFEQTVANLDCSFEDAVENIDIGGPTMLRSAAKNMHAVTIVTDPADYPEILAAMQANAGDTTPELRKKLAQKGFARVASYNAAIATYMAGQLETDDAPKPFVLAYSGGETLRYGENPHQSAIVYKDAPTDEPAIAHCTVLHGKGMSYNNYVDGNAALECVKEFVGTPAVSIIKHTNPCGCATGATLAEAFEAGWAGDPISAFGSVIAVTVPVDLEAAKFLKGRFVEVLIAPGYEPDALEYLQSKSKDLRLLQLDAPMGPAKKTQEIKQITGGLLVQDRDTEVNAGWDVKSKAAFPDDKRALAEFGVRVCKHVKSNAILLVREYEAGKFCVLGMGAGQPNRVDAVRKLAVTKAKQNIADMDNADEAAVLGEAVLISDAFFPFPDNIHNANEAGIKFIVEPGGSKRDNEVIDAADEYGMGLAFTGMRHFKH